MGIETVLLSLGAGAISGVSNFMGQNSQIDQQKTQLRNSAADSRYQGAQLGYQANVAKQSAGIQEVAGVQEQDALQDQRVDMARNYEAQKGQNIAGTASANVDLSSGSALDAIIGNASLFAEDMAQQSQNAKLAKWENAELVKALNVESDFLKQQEQYMYNQASYYEQVASNLEPSLLQSVFSFAGGILGGIR